MREGEREKGEREGGGGGEGVEGEREKGERVRERGIGPGRKSLHMLSRVHTKEKRVSNCTIPTHKRCFRSTKYTCVCSVLHSGVLLSKQLYKSMLDDLST